MSGLVRQIKTKKNTRGDGPGGAPNRSIDFVARIRVNWHVSLYNWHASEIAFVALKLPRSFPAGVCGALRVKSGPIWEETPQYFQNWHIPIAPKNSNVL
jgi:hypothetical protein